MNAARLAIAFYKDEVRMRKYGEAIELLRATGMENLLRRLGEPEKIPLTDSNHAQISAFAQAEARGWFAALDMLFNFEERIIQDSGARKTTEPDFGAEQQLRNLGYTDEEIAKAMEE